MRSTRHYRQSRSNHGVMEKARDVAVIPGDFGWSDVGSWLSAWELAAKDRQANRSSQNTILKHSADATFTRRRTNCGRNRS